MFGNYYYHETLRKVNYAFGTIFNNIYIVRKKTDNTEVKRIEVPINFGPRNSYLIRQKDDKELNRPVDIILPQMSYQLTSFTYLGNAKLNTIHTELFQATPNTTILAKQFMPVTYKIGIELSIMTKYLDDANQIVEQILPHFTPTYTISINAIPALQLVDDIPFTLRSVDMVDNYDDNWIERRNIIWTLHFDSIVRFYGPILKAPLITQASVDTLVPSGGVDLDSQTDLETVPRVQRYTVIPDPPNSGPQDDFGYTETFEDFDDGKKYNPVTGNDEDI